MKAISFVNFILLITLHASQANVTPPKTFPVVVRQGAELAFENQELKDLIQSDAFEGRYFKIIKGTEDRAIAFHADPDLVLRAATAYYHLTLARDYFSRLQHIDQPRLHTQTVVRIEQDRQFSPFIHFKSEKFKLYNQSFTVSGSTGADGSQWANTKDNPHAPDPEHTVDPWEPEIWFHQAHPTDRVGAWKNLGKYINSDTYKNPILLELLLQNGIDLTRTLIESQGKPDGELLRYHTLSVLAAIGITELIPWLFEKGTQILKTKYALDTVMIPEIIYNEYAHLALMKTLGLYQPSLMVEGYANYYAYKISGLIHLADHGGKYIQGDAPKRGDSQELYHWEDEYALNPAASELLFSILVDLENTLGEEGPRIMDTSVKYLTPTSDLKNDLQSAIYQAALEVSQHPTHATIRAQSVFQQRGL